MYSCSICVVDPLCPLVGRIDDGWQHLLARAARDHVESHRIRRRVSYLDVVWLTREHDGVCRGVTQALVSLIEEENLALIDSLHLASNLGYLLTQRRGHYTWQTRQPHSCQPATVTHEHCAHVSYVSVLTLICCSLLAMCLACTQCLFAIATQCARGHLFA